MKQDLKFSCKKECLSEIRAYVNSALTPLNISDSLQYKIVLAVDEACANAIIHGHDCDEKEEITVELELSDEGIFIVKIFDVGNCSQDYENLKSISLDEHINNKDKGGLGLKLIFAIMDEVRFYAANQHYYCRLAKELV